jgi:heme-degrading monooxygenase HmoA
MKTPWKTLERLEPDQEYVVLATRLPPRSRSSTLRLARGAAQIRKQLGNTDGVVGFSLVARPWKKDYATLSVWKTDEALDAFVKHEPHAELMASLSPLLAPTTFVRWTMRGSDGKLGISPSGGRVVMTLAGTGAPTRGGRRG